MNTNTNILNDLIESFLSGEIDGITFEKKFTDLFDFEELEDSIVYSFQDVRELLEHYTSDAEDLREYPKFYINEKVLKERILNTVTKRL